jgi:hypothetical protein
MRYQILRTVSGTEFLLSKKNVQEKESFFENTRKSSIFDIFGFQESMFSSLNVIKT